MMWRCSLTRKTWARRCSRVSTLTCWYVGTRTCLRHALYPLYANDVACVCYQTPEAFIAAAKKHNIGGMGQEYDLVRTW